MKVTIIIPVFNVDQFIEQCIRSVIKQTYANIEVIIVDDCGTDRSIDIAKKTINKHKTSKACKILKHAKNRGLSAARNTGIKAASGEYIYFLDGDDELDLECIEKLVRVASVYRTDFIISDYKVVGVQRLFPPLNLDGGLITSNEHILKSYIERDWYMMAFNKLVNRLFLLTNSLFFKEGIVHEDELWSFMLACKANSLYVVKEETYFYKVRKGSITQSPTIHNLQSLSEIISGMADFIKSNRELIGNKLIYNYFEEMKSIYFFNIITSNTDKQFKYSFYLNIRNTNYLSNPFPIKDYNLNSARIIRNLHYVLSPVLGFFYYKKLLYIKRKLNI